MFHNIGDHFPSKNRAQTEFSKNKIQKSKMIPYVEARVAFLDSHLDVLGSESHWQ